MKKLLNLRTPLFIGASLIIGIIFAYCVYLKKVFPAVLSAVVFASSIFLFVFYSVGESKGKSWLILSLIFISFAIFGGVSFYVITYNFDNADLGNHIVTTTGRVVDITEGEGYRKVILSRVNLGYPENVKTPYKISVTLLGDGEIEFGDTISFTSVLSDRSIIYNGRFNVYDVGNGVKYSAQLSSGEYTVIDSSPNLFEKVRIFIRDTLKGGLDKEEFAVVYALLTGYSDYMEDRTITNFRASGVAHIFAVSGLHIGFLSTALTFLLTKLNVKKGWRAILIVLSLVFYSGVCGFSASSIRATVMCAVMLFATIFGERYDGLTAIGVALIILLVLFPVQLFFAGFQLSFAVVFAILVLSNPTSRLLKFLPEKVASALSTVLVAQIASIPIMIIHFGEFSIISVLVNLIFLPAVSVIFIFALISVFLAGILSISQILLPLNYVMKAIIFLINAVDFTVFMVGGISISLSVIFYYLSFFVASGMVNVKKGMKIILSISFALLFVISTGVEGLVEFSHCKLYSFASDNFCATLVREKENDTLIVSKSSNSVNASAILDFAVKNRISEIDNLFILSSENGADAQVIYSALRDAFSIDNIYIHGEWDEKLVIVMSKSFPEVSLQFISSGTVDLGEISCNYLLGGKGIRIDSKNKTALIFGEIDGSEKFNTISNLTADFALYFEAEEFLNHKLNVKNPFAYNYSNSFKSVKNSGILIYYLK